jgi:hypothetical protein
MHLDITHMIVSAFKAFHGLSLASAAIVAAAGIGLIWLVSILTRRR